MGRKRHTAEQLIGKLRSAEIEPAKLAMRIADEHSSSAREPASSSGNFSY